MVRKFYLENEKGQKYDLMDRDNYCFLSSPSGLGYAYETSYEQVGNNFITNIRKLQQGNILGEAIFRNYDNYKNMVDYIEQAKSLKFVYEIPFVNKNSTKYYKIVEISSVEKGEKSTDGFLHIPINFNCKSLWYEETETVYDMAKNTGEIRWDFKWDSRFKSYDNRSFTFENNGHVEAPIKLEIGGYVINPCLTIYSNKNKIAEINFNMTLEEYEKILYSTKDDELYVYKENQDGTLTNIFDDLDLAKYNFIKIPQGVSEIRLSADSEITDTKLTIFVEYKAV